MERSSRSGLDWWFLTTHWGPFVWKNWRPLPQPPLLTPLVRSCQLLMMVVL